MGPDAMASIKFYLNHLTKENEGNFFFLLKLIQNCCCLVANFCLTLSDPMDYSTPDSVARFKC